MTTIALENPTAQPIAPTAPPAVEHQAEPQLPPPRGALVPLDEPEYSFGWRVWLVTDIEQNCCGNWQDAIPHIVTGIHYDGDDYSYSITPEDRRYACEPRTWHAADELSSKPWTLAIEPPAVEDVEADWGDAA